MWSDEQFKLLWVLQGEIYLELWVGVGALSALEISLRLRRALRCSAGVFSDSIIIFLLSICRALNPSNIYSLYSSRTWASEGV